MHDIDLVGDAKRRTKVEVMFAVVGVIVLAVGVAMGVWHGEELLEMPGGMVLFSFAGAWLLIVLAKLIMTPLLQREENYYTEDFYEEQVWTSEE